jgi:genome maintenance exonuclease 1
MKTVVFNHVKSKKIYRIGVMNTPNGRFYISPSGVRLPSVTTILGYSNSGWVDKWRERVGFAKADKISRDAAARGTMLHAIAEDYLNNENPNINGFMPYMKSMFLEIRKEINRIDNIRYLETTLYSESLRTAGTTDCIAEFDGELSIIDFKTSSSLKSIDRIETYFEQETAYSLMLEEMTGLVVPKIVTLIVNDNQYETQNVQVFVNDRKDYIDSLKEKIEKYHRERPVNEQIFDKDLGNARPNGIPIP